MSAIMVGRWQKISKLHWLKHPKTVPKNKIWTRKQNDWKSHIWSLSTDFRFSGRKSQNQQKPAKRITYITIQFCSKNLTYFTNLNLLNIIKIILRQHSQKRYLLYIFSSKNVSGWCQKKNCTAPFPDIQERHSRSTWKTRICIFL